MPAHGERRFVVAGMLGASLANQIQAGSERWVLSFGVAHAWKAARVSTDQLSFLRTKIQGQETVHYGLNFFFRNIRSRLADEMFIPRKLARRPNSWRDSWPPSRLDTTHGRNAPTRSRSEFQQKQRAAVTIRPSKVFREIFF
jgi:hypothetical protein